MPSIARGLAARGSGRGDSEMWVRDEGWSGKKSWGLRLVAVDVLDVDEAGEGREEGRDLGLSSC